MELIGKVAIVTGAASGIGRATAELFAREGAKIVAADWNGSRLDEVIETIRRSGAGIEGVQGDVARESDCDAMIAKAVAAFGRLDVLVNNAGIMDLDQPAGSLDPAVWRKVMGVNLDGPMWTTRAAVPVMLRTGGGSIVNIASVAGLGGGAAGAAYTASKHGLIGLTLNTAWMYAKQGIRCNAIAAGAVNTRIMESVDQTKLDPDGLARASEYYPLIPATLEPLEIARVVLFLAGEGTKHLTGAVIPVDGGWRSA